MASQLLVSRHIATQVRTLVHFVTMPWALAGLIFAAQSAFAADDLRQSIVQGLHFASGDATHHPIVRCPQNSVLVGVGANFTDRMVGYWHRCAEVEPSTGRWKADSAVITWGIGQVRRNPARWHDCPQDYYIVGLGVTTGIYSADTHGAAKPEVPPLLADIQPLCRLPGASPVVSYATPRAYFEGAEDNKLNDILPASPPNSPRACAAGSVAVGLQFSVDFRRDLDPESQFIDVALICGHLPRVIILKERDTRVPNQ